MHQAHELRHDQDVLEPLVDRTRQAAGLLTTWAEAAQEVS
jgi:hypothetical protein